MAHTVVPEHIYLEERNPMVLKTLYGPKDPGLLRCNMVKIAASYGASKEGGKVRWKIRKAERLAWEGGR